MGSLRTHLYDITSPSTLKSDRNKTDSKAVNKETTEKRTNSFSVVANENFEGLHKDLASLVGIHSYGIPIKINFSPFLHNSVVKKTSGIQGIFHCQHCLSNWKNSGQISFSCNQAAKYTEGSKVVISVNDAATLLSALRWSKKFSSKNIDQLLSMLLKAGVSQQDDCSGQSSNDNLPTSQTTDADVKCEGNENIAEATQSMLKTIIISKPNSDKALNADANTSDLLSSISIIGLQQDNGNFYQGFFSNNQVSPESSQNIAPENVFTVQGSKPSAVNTFLTSDDCSKKSSSLSFIANGRFDSDGNFLSCSPEELSSFKTTQYSSLRDVVQAQSSTSCLAKSQSGNNEKKLSSPQKDGLLSSEFKLMVKQGLLLDLNEVFASGLWHVSKESNYFIAGVFDSKGIFRAAYCITSDGYLIPGATDNDGKFVPLSQYNEDGTLSEAHVNKQELDANYAQLLQRLKKAPNCPTAHDLQTREDPDWNLVRRGSIILTPCDASVFEDNSFEDKMFIVYLGGELGPDKEYYPYGRYDQTEAFSPGGPRLFSHVPMKEFPNMPVTKQEILENFFKKFGFRIEDRSKSLIESMKEMTQDEIISYLSKVPQGCLSRQANKKSIIDEILAKDSHNKNLSRRDRKRIHIIKKDNLFKQPSLVVFKELNRNETNLNPLHSRRSSGNWRPRPYPNMLTPSMIFGKEDFSQDSLNNIIIGRSLTAPSSAKQQYLKRKKLLQNPAFLAKLQNANITPQMFSSILSSNQSEGSLLESLFIRNCNVNERDQYSSSRSSSNTFKPIRPESSQSLGRSTAEFSKSTDAQKIAMMVDAKSQKETENISQKIIGDHIGFSTRFLKKSKRRKSTLLKSELFEEMENISVLNFTKNFSFSYFDMPTHVKEHNHKVNRGPLKLPSLANDGKVFQGESWKDMTTSLKIRRKSQRQQTNSDGERSSFNL